ARRVPRRTVRYDARRSAARRRRDAPPRGSSTVWRDGDPLTIKSAAAAPDVATPPMPPPGPQSLVTAVRVVDATTIAVDLGPRFNGFRSTSQQVDTAARLAIDLVAQVEATPAPPQPAPPAPPPPEIPPGFAQASSAIHTIAIDPGHGGDDDGVRSAGGLKEKELTLAVARRGTAAMEAPVGPCA